MQNHPRLASYDERVSIKNLLLTVTMVTTVTTTTGVNNKLEAATLQRQHVTGARTNNGNDNSTRAHVLTTATTVRRVVQLFTCLNVQLLFVITIVIKYVLSLSSGRSSTTHRQSINSKQSQRATNCRVATHNRVGVNP